MAKNKRQKRIEFSLLGKLLIGILILTIVLVCGKGLIQRKQVNTSKVYGISTPKSKGACGEAVNSCSSGRFVDVNDTSTQFKWSCEGINGGGDTICSMPKGSSKLAVCGKTVNSCVVGFFVQVDDTEIYHRWICRNTDGKMTSTVNCYLNKPRNQRDGVCGKYMMCEVGEAVKLPDSVTSHRWQCLGIKGGKTVDCSTTAPCGGVTSNTPINVCYDGKFVDVPDTECFVLWKCTNLTAPKGQTITCTRNKVFAGVCGKTKNSCTKGIFSDVVDNSTQYKWTCKGCNGGSLANCTLKK